jgi:hypothetical protein
MLQEVIQLFLSGNSALNTLVNGQIYPVIAPATVTNNYIVHSGIATPVYSKSGREYDEFDYSIFIASQNYSDNNTIATFVRSIIEFKLGIFEEIKILKNEITSIDELYSEEDQAFLKRIQLKIIVI